MKPWALIVAVVLIVPQCARSQDVQFLNAVPAISVIYGPGPRAPKGTGFETLEWAAADSDLIVRGVVRVPSPNVLSSLTEPWGNWWFGEHFDFAESTNRSLMVQVVETLKGPATQRLLFRPPQDWRDPRDTWAPGNDRHLLMPGAEVLLFMRRSSEAWLDLSWPRHWIDRDHAAQLDLWSFGVAGPSNFLGSDALSAGDYEELSRYTLRSDWLVQHSTGMIELSTPVFPSLPSNDFRVYHQPGELLNRLRQIIRSQDGQTHKGPGWVPVPRSLRSSSASESGLPPYLLTIPDDWHWPLIMDHAGTASVELRLLLVDYLHTASPPRANQLLTQLLSDSAYHRQNGGRRTKRFYPVRARALEILRARGAPIPAHIVLEPDDLYRPARVPAWSVGALAVLLCAAAVTARRWRQHVRVSAVLATAVLIASASLWLVSRWRVLDVQWNTRWSVHQVTLAAGGVAYVREGFFNSEAARPRYCWTPLHTDLDPAWSPWSVHTDYRLDRWGVIWGRSRAWAPGEHDRVARAPLWFPVLGAAAVLILSARARARRWRWQRQGRCSSCGYDLRHSAARCPECGRTRNKPAAELTSAAPS